MTHDFLTRLAVFARERIAKELGKPPENPQELDAVCNEVGASFVTVRWKDGRLQGCIGSLEARRSLRDDVTKNALAAAFADPRAAPLALSDLENLRVEVSVLSPLEPVAYDGTEEGARRAIHPGDGVVLAIGERRATFLPQMWTELPLAEEFLNELKRKAHLSPTFWSSDIVLRRYTVAKGYA
jgi:hypothetical protein